MLQLIVIVLAVILIFWGLRAWRAARLIAVRNLRLAARLGGVSLALVGLIMLSLAWMPLGWIAPLGASTETRLVTVCRSAKRAHAARRPSAP